MVVQYAKSLLKIGRNSVHFEHFGKQEKKSCTLIFFFFYNV